MPKDIILDFAKAISSQNIDAIYSLMSEDHAFIDPYGNTVVGRDNMKAGWAGYFQWFPDYKIEITDIISNEDFILAAGYASGTFKGLKTEKNENYWRIPAAWKVIVTDEKIKVWQVYADTKIPFDIISRNTN